MKTFKIRLLQIPLIKTRCWKFENWFQIFKIVFIRWSIRINVLNHPRYLKDERFISKCCLTLKILKSSRRYEYSVVLSIFVNIYKFLKCLWNVLGAGYVTSKLELLIILWYNFDFLLHFVEKVCYAIMLVHYFLRMNLADYLQEI